MKTKVVKLLSVLILLSSAGAHNAYAVKYVNGKKYFSYMVQTGETVESLANAFRVTVEELIAQNPNMTGGNMDGQIILVPVKESMLDENLPEISIITYKVKPGDTLFSLAKNNNSTIEDIIQRNAEQLSDGVLRAGSVIQIAKNSGGLTGGEDAKEESAKKKKAEELMRKAQKPSYLQAELDSLAKKRMAYWTEPWTIIDVKEPGTIDSLRTDAQWRLITRLKVTGKINSQDVSVIGKRTFEFDKIKALDLHDAMGLTKLKTKDFQECTSLKAISLPNTVTTIEADAFSGSGGSLEVLRCYAVNPPACTDASFNNIDFKFCELQVPQSALQSYKAAPEWKNFISIKAIPVAGAPK